MPPKRFWIVSSACVKGMNRRPMACGSSPMPVSSTRNHSRARPPRASRQPSDTRTKPCSVNLIALPTRLSSTCLRRVASVTMPSGTGRGTSMRNSSPLRAARVAITARTSDSTANRLQGAGLISRRPASIFEMSSTSSIRCIRWSALRRIMPIDSRRSSSFTAGSSSCSAKPRIEVIGVRISWLMLARKALFRRLASSELVRAASAPARAASLRASDSSSCARCSAQALSSGRAPSASARSARTSRRAPTTSRAISSAHQAKSTTRQREAATTAFVMPSSNMREMRRLWSRTASSWSSRTWRLVLRLSTTVA